MEKIGYLDEQNNVLNLEWSSASCAETQSDLINMHT